MHTVDATELKNRLGAVLARAALGPVAIRRHGRVVAYLSPAAPKVGPFRATRHAGLSRAAEERLARLCASGDLRPSRWRKAGDAQLMAGVATMLASQPGSDRVRLLALAEQLDPGMTDPGRFGQWLLHAPVKAARLMPMVRAEMSRPRP